MKSFIAALASVALLVAGATLASAQTHQTQAQTMPNRNLPGWRLVFDDDFSKTVPVGSFPSAVMAKWGHSYPDGWPDTSHTGTYEPSKDVSYHNSELDANLHTVNGVTEVAAAVPTIPRAVGKAGGQLYGRYAVRFKTSSVKGFKTAFMLWPDSNNSKTAKTYDGEIDYPEGGLADNFISAYTHHTGVAGINHGQDGFHVQVSTHAWHTYVTEWTPGKVAFFLDGKKIGSSPNAIPNVPMHWVLQNETSLTGHPSPSADAHVIVAWVSVWAYDPEMK